jgi:alpha-glucosidase
MKKKLLLFLLPGIIIFGIYKGYKYYGHYQEEQRRASYYENLVDTSSPTVTVLRDSIKIGYQNENRTIHLYVPPNYEDDTLARYPVIYMLDGESSFNDLANMGPEWEIDEVINTAFENGKQTAIVVGINQSENRDAEYTPFVNDDNPDAHGAEFSNWVTTDLKNWIDTNYRTKTEASATTIGGISRSGMMAYYMLMAHPDVFGNAMIQSPSMWVDYDRLMALSLTKDQLRDKKIFVSVGEYEGGIMIPHAEDVYAKFEALGLGEDQLKYELIPNEAHWHITWRKSFALGYPWLME